MTYFSAFICPNSSTPQQIEQFEGSCLFCRFLFSILSLACFFFLMSQFPFPPVWVKGLAVWPRKRSDSFRGSPRLSPISEVRAFLYLYFFAAALPSIPTLASGMISPPSEAVIVHFLWTSLFVMSFSFPYRMRFIEPPFSTLRPCRPAGS